MLNTLGTTSMSHDEAVRDGLMAVAWQAAQNIMKIGGFVRANHFSEIFAGHSEITLACWRASMRGLAFDRLLNVEQDMCSLYGFTYAIMLVASIVKGGLLWLAPQCSTWLSFVSAYTMQRKLHNQYEGDTCRLDVLEANCTARCIAFLIRFATARGVRFIVENPQTSFLWKYPPLVQALRECSAVTHNTYHGAFGGRSVKPLTLYSTVHPDFIMRHLVRPRREAKSKVDVLRASNPANAGPLIRSVRFKKGKGRAWKQGNKNNIADSAAYTKEFGEAVATMLACMFLSTEEAPQISSL